jgi:SpoVK/Ycf46/Vps4 family AAA+-type ATPase
MLSQLREHVDACFTALWVQTHEPDEALAEIRRMAADNGWNLLHWDAALGLNGDGNGEGNQQFGGSRDRHEVTGRLIGAMLSFMQEQAGAFFVLTANEIASLPGPLMRAGRMDAVYFVDLPGEEQREVIWGIHLAKYGLGADHVIPSSEGWSGAEIEHCCRTAAMYGLSLEAAAGFVVPVATSQAVEIEALRQWPIQPVS